MRPILSSQTRTSTKRIHGCFIDQILFKVLRWDENDVWLEEYVKNVGYLDYEFGRPQCSLVLEAKREGKTFILPVETIPLSRFHLVSLLLSAKRPPLGLRRLRPTRNLARRSRYSAISNGYQWLLP